MKRKVDFDWYCKTKKDVINNAAYELIVALTAKSAPPRKFELSIPQWDDLMIANIVENAINAIDERIGYYCHPFYHEVDKLPCYLGDRCDNPHCIFKSDPDYESMTHDELEDRLDELRTQRDTLECEEPDDLDGEAYEEWEEQCEQLDEKIEEIEDLLEG